MYLQTILGRCDMIDQHGECAREYGTSTLRHRISSNPLTGTVEYSDDELEFLRAVEEYKRTRRRPFPTWREVLAIIHSLGYRKVEEKIQLPKWPPIAYTGE